MSPFRPKQRAFRDEILLHGPSFYLICKRYDCARQSVRVIACTASVTPQVEIYWEKSLSLNEEYFIMFPLKVTVRLVK